MRPLTDSYPFHTHGMTAARYDGVSVVLHESIDVTVNDVARTFTQLRGGAPIPTDTCRVQTCLRSSLPPACTCAMVLDGLDYDIVKYQVL